ncbi:hypothetical protein EGI31_00805 [Lacihabitans soyangensis]|uniref:Uncharacterized protein n=1 Tax=Lacihabitans soyangensis TaxID=869394 RepID=A0AAE3GZW6_9BACT|nr:hypothetical protein [Lacihabitans soyangensis]
MWKEGIVKQKKELHLCNSLIFKWAHLGSNQAPTDYESLSFLALAFFCMLFVPKMTILLIFIAYFFLFLLIIH